MQVILLEPQRELQLPLLAQTILYLSQIYLKFLNVYCEMHDIFMSKIVFI